MPKYRRMVLEERIAKRLQEIFQEMAEWNGLTIDTQEVLDDHVPILLSIPPR